MAIYIKNQTDDEYIKIAGGQQNIPTSQSVYELACGEGFKGTSEDFYNTLSNIYKIKIAVTETEKTEILQTADNKTITFVLE